VYGSEVTVVGRAGTLLLCALAINHFLKKAGKTKISSIYHYRFGSDFVSIKLSLLYTKRS